MASRFPALGAHSTWTFMDIGFKKLASSVTAALAGKRVAISLVSADQLPRLSVQVEVTITLLFVGWWYIAVWWCRASRRPKEKNVA